MTVRVVQSSFSEWKIEPLWPAGKGIRATLVLTDPDNQQQTDVIEWMATADIAVEDIAETLAGQIEELPHWRARSVRGSLRIGTASEDYSGESVLEVI